MCKKIFFYFLLLSFIFIIPTNFCFGEDTLAKILKTGKVKIGVRIDSPPFGFKDKNGEIKGFEIDLAKYIVNYMSVKYERKLNVEYISVTPKTRLNLLQKGKVDFVIATVSATYERDYKVDFSIYYFISEGKIIVRKDSGINSSRDLDNKKIGVLKGSTSQNWLYRVNYKIYPVVYLDYISALKSLEAGKIVGIAGDDLILIGLKNKSKIKNNLYLLPESFSFEQYAVAIRENNSNLRDEINFALMQAFKSGDYDEIYEKWFVKNPEFNFPLSKRKAIALILQCYFQ